MHPRCSCALVAALAFAGCGERALAPDGRGADAGLGGGGSAAGAGATAGVGPGAAGAGGGVGGAAGAGISDPRLTISASFALKRIAEVLWRQPPDEDVLQAAAMGSFQTKKDLADAVRAMLSDGRATAGVAAFYRWWLSLDKISGYQGDPKVYPESTPALRADMVDETTNFGVQVTLQLNGTYETLMTAPFSFVNAPLANLYGVSAPPDGPDGALVKVALPVDERAGLLTQPALQVLGAYAFRTSPSHRGAYTARTILCEAVPSAPANVPPLDPLPADATTRAGLAKAVGSPTCTPCHERIDPLGLAFERFDAIGRVRTTDHGAPVDTSNLTILLPEPDGNLARTVVDGPVELAKLLSRDPLAETCMARQWLAFALGRDLTDHDEPSVSLAFAGFSAAGFNLKELIVAVLTSDAFLTGP
jgi:Protein of unknown function (DUF1592)/Protein of unknown function (DUF1588)/Protein of unknown function (DUF1585)